MRKISLILLPLVFLLTISVASASSVGNSNSGTVSQAEGGTSEGISEVSVEDNSTQFYYEPSFSPAEGTDTLQLGSWIFGGLTVSRDMRTLELRRNIVTVSAMRNDELISEESAKEFAEWTVKELKNETKPRKCFAIIPCGRERSLRNLFGLLW